MSQFFSESDAKAIHKKFILRSKARSRIKLNRGYQEFAKILDEAFSAPFQQFHEFIKRHEAMSNELSSVRKLILDARDEIEFTTLSEFTPIDISIKCRRLGTKQSEDSPDQTIYLDVDNFKQIGARLRRSNLKAGKAHDMAFMVLKLATCYEYTSRKQTLETCEPPFRFLAILTGVVIDYARNNKLVPLEKLPIESDEVESELNNESIKKKFKRGANRAFAEVLTLLYRMDPMVDAMFWISIEMQMFDPFILTLAPVFEHLEKDLSHVADFIKDKKSFSVGQELRDELKSQCQLYGYLKKVLNDRDSAKEWMEIMGQGYSKDF